jgi:3-(3-hydroxy-phenyl)propionate hydroxylase
MAHETASDNDVGYTANWVVGTDGANSNVRRNLCIPFEGFSFTDMRMIGADVYYDFREEYDTVMNFIVDPEDWAVVIYTGQHKDMKPAGEAPPLWRVAYVESPELSSKPEDIFERAKERCARYTNDRKSLDVTRAEPYRLHQRCAAQAIKGRVVLAGDALHANNPIGGLGLTTGICAYTDG